MGERLFAQCTEKRAKPLKHWFGKKGKTSPDERGQHSRKPTGTGVAALGVTPPGDVRHHKKRNRGSSTNQGRWALRGWALCSGGGRGHR